MRYWNIKMTSRFKQMFGNALMKGQDPRSSGTSSFENLGLQAYTISPNSNVISEIRNRLETEVPILEYNKIENPQNLDWMLKLSHHIHTLKLEMILKFILNQINQLEKLNY